MTIQLSPLLKGLVLHAPLDQESYNPATKRFTDNAGYANHGTSANAASFVADRMGQADRAMTFDGSSDYVDCGSGDSLDITDAITIAVWVKFVDITDARYIVGMDDGTNRNWALYYHVSTNSMRFFALIDGGGIVKDYTFTPTLNQWYHIVATVDGSNLRLYMDGSDVGDPVSYSGNIDKDVVDLLIGKKGNNAYYFYGSIADVRIYNRALTEAEITLLYESYRPRLVI